MPPQFWQAGPSSRPARRAGRTGGVSVSADVGGCGADGALAAEPLPFDGVAFGADGPAVSDEIDIPVSSAAFLARTSVVRIPSSSWISASRKRDASQRIM